MTISSTQAMTENGSTANAIVVIGSINMDLVCRTPRMPQPGETILGRDFVTIPGGKGANQAVASANLVTSHQVHLIGRVGQDAFGTRLLEDLQAHGVQTGFVKMTPDVASGCAFILVDDEGENSIVVISGANDHLSPQDIDQAEGLLKTAVIVLFQLEVPLETVAYALERCREFGVPTILDPAPAPPQGLPPTLFQVDLLTPNESETEIILAYDGIRDSKIGEGQDQTEEIGQILFRQGVKTVVLKQGAAGAMLIRPDEVPQPVAGFPAQVVDTTAAGDAFAGALAVALSEGQEIIEAIRFANAAGALCCETLGAQPAMPTRAQVEQRLWDKH